MAIDDITGVTDFTTAWQMIDQDHIAILPIENSRAGSIHENIYNFLRHDHQVIGQYDLVVEHCLLSYEDDISGVSRAYSHYQALSQCHDFLQKHQIKPVKYVDTAGAAKLLQDTREPGAAAIASSLAAEIYGLNTLASQIQDQSGNTTRFFIVASSDTQVTYNDKKNKTTIIFETKDIPASLYKCLGAFATNNVNLTKIESLPSLKNPFSYMFWCEFIGNPTDAHVQSSLEELALYTQYSKIIGSY